MRVPSHLLKLMAVKTLLNLFCLYKQTLVFYTHVARYQKTYANGKGIKTGKGSENSGMNSKGMENLWYEQQKHKKVLVHIRILNSFLVFVMYKS